MRKLRIGVWVLENYGETKGGGFGYYTQILDALEHYIFSDAEITFITEGLDTSVFSKHKTYQVKAKKLNSKDLFFKNITKKLNQKFGFNFFKIYYKKKEKRYLNDLKNELQQVIDVIYYPTPVVKITNFPYIYTLWDIGHKSTFAFPETSMNNSFEDRKRELELVPHKALMVFCESEAGKKDAVKFLNINVNRIRVVPIFPSGIIDPLIVPLQPMQIENKVEFIHYPAQFWAHKNHYNLLVSFKELLKIHPNLKLFFTGSDKGNKAYILSVIEELGLGHAVFNLGFVSVEELKWMYLNSLGLVMPTFLGPTNMPLLEAAALECPVACSDFEGHREQLGNYAYYFNPLSVHSIYTSLDRMIVDKRNNIKNHYSNKFNIGNALKSIDDSFTEMKQIRFCWGDFDLIK